MATLAKKFAAIGVGELAKGVVQDLAFCAVAAKSLLATAHAVAFDRKLSLDPVGNIEVVDMLLADLIAANPVEVVPVVDLKFHFGLSRLAVAVPDSAAVPVHPLRNDIANRAVVNPLDRFDIAGFVPAL